MYIRLYTLTLHNQQYIPRLHQGHLAGLFYKIIRPLLTHNRSLLQDNQASFDTYAYLRYVSVLPGLFYPLAGLFCQVSRPLLTLTHTCSKVAPLCPARAAPAITLRYA